MVFEKVGEHCDLDLYNLENRDPLLETMSYRCTFVVCVSNKHKQYSNLVHSNTAAVKCGGELPRKLGKSY